MLTAQRFTSISQSTNLGLAALADIKDNSVYNTVANQLSVASDSLKSVANSMVQNTTGFDITSVETAVDDSLRAVKDTFTTLKDVTGISQAELEKEISEILPVNKELQQAFRNLSAACRDNSFGKRSGFKKFDDKFSCGSKGGKCSSSEVSGLLNKFTKGAINAVSSSIQSILQSLITLANLGYSGGLCKIFGELINGMSPKVVQRGAAALLATMGGTNMTAVFDISANMGDAIPSLEVPFLVGRITDTFKTPGSFASGGLKDLYSASMDAYSLIQPDFDKSTDDLYSIANMGNSLSNPDFSAAASEYLNSDMLGDLDTPVYTNRDELAVSYISDKLSDPFADLGAYS